MVSTRAQMVSARVTVQALVHASFTFPATTASTLDELRVKAAIECREALRRTFVVENGGEASGWVDNEDAFVMMVELKSVDMPKKEGT